MSPPTKFQTTKVPAFSRQSKPMKGAIRNFLKKKVITKIYPGHHTQLGWQINLEKSNIIPSPKGYTTTQKIILPEDKVAKLVNAVEQLRTSSEGTRRGIMSLLGLMSGSIPAVQWGQIHMRAF